MYKIIFQTGEAYSPPDTAQGDVCVRVGLYLRTVVVPVAPLVHLVHIEAQLAASRH